MLRLKLNTLATRREELAYCKKSLMLGKIGSVRKRGCQKTRWLDGITDAMDMSVSSLRELVMDREPWHAAVHRVTETWT